jgi:hypothetical protein
MVAVTAIGVVTSPCMGKSERKTMPKVRQKVRKLRGTRQSFEHVN